MEIWATALDAAFEPDEPVKENSSEKDELDESLSELQRLADS